jgi:predicted double-glycine peptidase
VEKALTANNLASARFSILFAEKSMRLTFNRAVVSSLAIGIALSCCCTGCGESASADNIGETYRSLKAAPNLIQVPLTRQAADYTCGAAALQSVLGYFGKEFRQDELVKSIKSDPDNGTPYQNIVQYARSLGFVVSTHTDLSLDELKGFIDNRQPVLLAIQAWMDPPRDWTTYESGHYVVAIGYDRDVIYFMDPSTLGNYTYIPITEFLSRWHDRETDGTQLNHFGIVMNKADAVRYDPDNIKPMN